MPHPAFPFLFAPLLASSSPTPAPQAPAAPTNDPSLAAMNQAAKEAEHPKKEYIDYGWQIWIANATVIAPTILMFNAKDPEVRENYIKLAGFLYFVPPAVIHFSHGQVAVGFASAVGRVPGILAGIGLTSIICLHVDASAGKSFCPQGVWGFLPSIMAAAAFDALFLSTKEVMVRQSSIRLAPSFGWSADRPSFGLSGSW